MTTSSNDDQSPEIMHLPVLNSDQVEQLSCDEIDRSVRHQEQLRTATDRNIELLLAEQSRRQKLISEVSEEIATVKNRLATFQEQLAAAQQMPVKMSQFSLEELQTISQVSALMVELLIVELQENPKNKGSITPEQLIDKLQLKINAAQLELEYLGVKRDRLRKPS